MERVLPLIKTPSDFVKLTSFRGPHVDWRYRQDVQGFAQKHLDRFFELKPTFDEVMKLLLCETVLEDEVFQKALLERALPLAQTDEAYARLLTLPVEHGDYRARQARTEILGRQKEELFQRKLTVPELIGIIKSGNQWQLEIELMTRALPRLKTAEEFLLLARM